MTTRSVLVAAVVLLAGSWLLVLALGISIPLDAARVPVEAILSRTLNRAVSIDGPIAVRPTLGPSVRIQNLRVAGRSGDGAEPLRAGQVELRLGLLSLLGGRPRVTHLQASDVTLSLDHADSAAGQSMPVDWLESLELSVHRLVLSYRSTARDPPLQLVIEQLDGVIQPGQPLQLAVGGRLGPFPYSADLLLPSLAALQRRGESWPLRAGMVLADTRLQLQGTLQPPATGQGPRLKLDLLGEPSAAAPVGTLALTLRDGRPVLDGELQLAKLDAGRLMPAGAAVAAFKWLHGIDATLDVRIADISHLPVAVRDTRARLTLREGRLISPVESSIAGVPFHGRVRFDIRQKMPLVTLSLAATDIDAATLLHGLPVFAGVQGEVARLALQAAVPAGGSTGKEAAVDIGMHLSGARLSYGNTPGGLPVPVVLDELSVSLPAAGALALTAKGALASAPFSVEVTGGSLDRLLQQQAWPVSMTATAGATLQASGELTKLSGYGTGTLNLEVSGDRLGDLAPWLGVPACAATPVTARGQLVLAEHIGRLQFIEARLGGTRLTGELDWSRDERLPLLHVVLHADSLDPADVAGLLPIMSYAGQADAVRGIRLDLPILPRPAVIANADIDLAVTAVAHRLVDIGELSFSGRLRSGRFQRSPFSARIGSRVLQGQLDTSGADTAVVFEVRADDARPGSLLDRLFSSAIQWAGNAGVVPLRWLFGLGLSGPDREECPSGSDVVSEPAAQ